VHIAKSLQKRSKAIRRAVAKYNDTALKLTPPRDTLDWQKVAQFSFIDEFQILRDTRPSLHAQPWANPVVRDLIKRYQRVKRAQEELVRCNVEVRRLHASIIDERHRFGEILTRLSSAASPLLHPVKEYITRRQGAQKILLARITQIYELKGFTGTPFVYERKGSAPSPSTDNTPHPPQPLAARDDEDDEDHDIEDDEEQEAQVGGIIDYIARLSID
jgi:hypothetical protein